MNGASVMSEKSTRRAGDKRSVPCEVAIWVVLVLAAVLMLIGIIGSAWGLS